MHMADALVSPAVAGTMLVLSGTATAFAARSLKKENRSRQLPLMGVLGAFVFAAQMINFSLPGTGSSGHIGGGILLAALLGPAAGFITLTAVLIIQCLMFADGGLLALGCNIWNMAFYACFVGAMFIWRPIVNSAGTKPSHGRIAFASVLAVVISLQLGAFSVVVETLLSGITDLPFAQFALLMQPIHLAIGLVEGLLTAAVLVFVTKQRPEIIWRGNDQLLDGYGYESAADGKFASLGQLATGFGIAALVIGGGLSLIASGDPDGLEWSIERITGGEEIALSPLAEIAQGIQEKIAFLPDYGFPTGESSLGTMFSGLVGAAIVGLAIWLVGRIALKNSRS